MKENQRNQNEIYRIKLPADLDYIPPLRQFISESARVKGFSKKFCFRTEVIIDELCTNAIIHGPKEGAGISINFAVQYKDNALEFEVKNKKGAQKDLERLQAVMQSKEILDKAKSKGIALSKVLSSEMSVDLDKEGYTCIKVVKKREIKISEPADS